MNCAKLFRGPHKIVSRAACGPRACSWTTLDYSIVTRWMKRINDGQEEPAESNFCNKPRSGSPFSVHSSANIDQADALIKENRRIIINELAESSGVSAKSAVKLMDTLGIQKCAQGGSQGSSQRLINNPVVSNKLVLNKLINNKLVLNFWSIALVTNLFAANSDRR